MYCALCSILYHVRLLGILPCPLYSIVYTPYFSLGILSVLYIPPGQVLKVPSNILDTTMRVLPYCTQWYPGAVGASETNFYHRHLRPDRASWKPPQPICFNQMAPISLSKQQQAFAVTFYCVFKCKWHYYSQFNLCTFISCLFWS